MPIQQMFMGYDGLFNNISNFTTPATISANVGGYSAAQLRSVAVSSSGLFVAVGYGGPGSGYLPAYTTSTNGSTWTTATVMNGSTTATTINSVAVNSSGLFVAVGYLRSNTYPVYATSTNGSNWTTPATMNGSTIGAAMTSVTVNSSGLFVAVGSLLSGNYPVYATSTDGSNWTTPAAMNGSTTAASMYSVAVNSSGLFVAVGYNGSNYPVYATSTDGSNWTTPALMNGSTTVAYMNSVAVNSSGLFVAIGNTIIAGSFYPVYATSTDGSTWTTPAVITGSAVNTNMNSVTVSSSGQFVAVGSVGTNFPSYTYKGVYALSTDGSTWTTPALMNGSSTLLQMFAVAVSPSRKFVSIGYNQFAIPYSAVGQ